MVHLAHLGPSIGRRVFDEYCRANVVLARKKTKKTLPGRILYKKKEVDRKLCQISSGPASLAALIKVHLTPPEVDQRWTVVHLPSHA